MKTADGLWSKQQRDLRLTLQAMDFKVYTVRADCPVAAWEQVRALLPSLPNADGTLARSEGMKEPKQSRMNDMSNRSFAHWRHFSAWGR
jgi:hypothetical protein